MRFTYKKKSPWPWWRKVKKKVRKNGQVTRYKLQEHKHL